MENNKEVLCGATRIRELPRNVVWEKKMCTTRKEMDRWCNSSTKEGDKVNSPKLAFICVPPPFELVIDVILLLNKRSFLFPLKIPEIVTRNISSPQHLPGHDYLDPSYLYYILKEDFLISDYFLKICGKNLRICCVWWLNKKYFTTLVIFLCFCASLP